MTPSENRRYWRALPVVLIGCGAIAMLLSEFGLGLGWIYLSFLGILGVMVFYVHHERAGERHEYEQLARESGVPYPPPRRKGWLRR